MGIFKKLNEEEGMTIIQGIHSENDASYGNRLIRLVDGQLVSDTKSQEVEANSADNN